MEYLYEGNFFDEDAEHTYSSFSLQLSDEEESDEDRIDSDVETALYSMIHHSENPSYECFQENSSTSTKINSNDTTISNNKSIRNSNNNVEMSSGVDTSNEKIITLSSDTNSDSDDIKFLCKVRKKDSSVPEVRVFNDKCNSNTYTRKENRKWWEKFVSITYDNENINFSEEHLQTVTDSGGTGLDQNNMLNLGNILNEDPWKSNSSKSSMNKSTVLNSNNTELDKNSIFNLKKRFSVNENPGSCESNSSKFSFGQNKVSNSDNKKLDKNGVFNLKNRFSLNENPHESNSSKLSSDQNKASNSNNTKLDRNSIFNLKKKFFSNENSQKSVSSKFAMDQNIESDSSEDIFRTPSMTSDNISINLSSNSSGPIVQHKEGIWHVNFEDLPQSHVLRYYSKSMSFMCRNCLKRGHRKKDCDQPKKKPPCLLCGENGHRTNKCLQKVCKICQSTGHKAKNCTGYMNSQIHCDVCQYDGHVAENCPDIWRRYHLTKDENCIVQGRGRVNTKVYCYNCGRKGHFGHQCKYSRDDDNSSATLPFVVSYKSSYSTSGGNNKKNNNNNNNKFKMKDKSLKLIQKKKKKRKSSNSNLAKNGLSSFSANCSTESTNQQNAENKSPLKFVQSVTDYVNLLHLPKENGKSKKQKKRDRTKTQPKEFNNKPVIIHLS